MAFNWMGVITQIVMMVAAWIVLLWFQQDSLIYVVRRYNSPLNAAALEPGFKVDELRFSTSEGLQHAIMLRDPASKRTSQAFLVFGGNGMLARDWISVMMQFRTTFRAGTAVVLVDYPGYGESEGSPSRASIVAVGKQALIEAHSALVDDDDQDAPDVKFGAIGHSIGCAAALALAADLQETGSPLHHLILSAPFTSLGEMAQITMWPLGFVPLQLLAALTSKHAWDNVADGERIAGDGAPKVSIIHGVGDSIVPHAMGEKLWKQLSAMNLSVTFKSVMADHNDLLSLREYGKWLDSVVNLH